MTIGIYSIGLRRKRACSSLLVAFAFSLFQASSLSSTAHSTGVKYAEKLVRTTVRSQETSKPRFHSFRTVQLIAQNAPDRSPETIDTLRKRGQASIAQRDFDTAKQTYRKLTSLRPTISHSTIAVDHAWLAFTLSQLQEHDKARVVAQRVHRAIPQLAKREVIDYGVAQNFFKFDAFVTRLLIATYRDLNMPHMALSLMGADTRNERLREIGGKHFIATLVLPGELDLEIINYYFLKNMRSVQHVLSLQSYLSYLDTTEDKALKAREVFLLLAILDFRTHSVLEGKETFCTECVEHQKRLEALLAKQKKNWRVDAAAHEIRARILTINGQLPKARRVYLSLLEEFSQRLRNPQGATPADRRALLGQIINAKTWLARLLLDQGDADLAHAQIEGAMKEAEGLFEEANRKDEMAFSLMIDLTLVRNRVLNTLGLYDVTIASYRQFESFSETLFEYDPRTYFALLISASEALVSAGQLDEAKTLLAKVRTRFSPNNHASSQSITAALLAAEVAERNRNFDNAFRILDSCWSDSDCIGLAGMSDVTRSHYLLALFDIKWVEYLRKAKGIKETYNLLSDTNVESRLMRGANALRLIRERGGYKGYARQMASGRLRGALKEALSIQMHMNWLAAKSIELPPPVTWDKVRSKIVPIETRSVNRLNYSDDKFETGFRRRYDSAFRAAQESIESVASDALAQMALRHGAGNADLANLVREQQDLNERWAVLDSQLIKAVSQSSGRRDYVTEAKLNSEMEKVEARIAKIKVRIKRDFPRYIDLLGAEPLTIAATQAQLGRDEALILVKPTAERTFIWVVTRAGSRWVRAELDNKTLTRDVEALRCGLDDSTWYGEGVFVCSERLGIALEDLPTPGSPLPFDTARAHSLYKTLFGEVADLISGKHLLIVPSGALSALPFQVLVTEPPSEARQQTAADYAKVSWLGQQNAITVLPSVASLKALRTQAKASSATNTFIGFGNPLLAGPEGADMRAWDKQSCPSSMTLVLQRQPRAAPVTSALKIASLFRGGLADVAQLRLQAPLPETTDELCAVARASGEENPDTVVHLGGHATETRVKALSADGTLARTKIIHFATHGLIADETASLAVSHAEPSLMLTPPQIASKQDDGLLTASEVAALKLNADWVILSACNTAAGDAIGGHAFSGLTRAFFYAGARALLVSHWYVDSQATVALVTRAFKALQRDPTLGRAEAMRRAMSRLIEGGDRNAHPANWAPFVLVGEGGAGR